MKGDKYVAPVAFEVIAAIIAARRGWGAIPIIMAGVSILITILLLMTPDSTNLFWAINIGVMVILALMAIAGRKGKAAK